jgi:adenylate cyclase
MNIYDQMKERVFLYRPNWAKGAEILFMSVFGFIIIFISPFASAFSLYFLLVSAITSGAFFGWHLFVQDGYLIDVLYPILVTFFILIINTILSYIRAEVDKKQIGDTLGMYVSPAYIEELAKKPENLKLGGETKELSVMFTDIRNFTSISESLTPEELIRLMNGFLTPMSDLVMSNHGTIDKYMGDAMMAFWNAPLDDPNHARNSCLTLLEMNKALKPLNDSLREKAENMGIKPILLEAGVGLNSGPASVGNMGSKQRFAYSALGDAVNLASRLEGQTKTYGVKNLVGENTQMQVRDFAFLELDLIRVKGKEEPVKIFTLLGDEKLAEHQEFRRWRETHNEMIETYRAAKFEKAADIINKCKEASEGNLSKYYDLILLRIGEFFAKPPPKDWDGVYVAKTK